MLTLSQVKKKLEIVNYLLTEKEIDVLYKYASKVPDDGKIVDIGTAAGGSAFTMSLGSKPSVKVTTIDPNQNEAFMHHLEEWGLTGKLTFYHGLSKDAVGEFANKSIDLLFVDGVHSYTGVMNDFNDYSPKVKSGGIIAFHDYFLYWNAISKAVDEIVASGKVETVEIIDSKYKGSIRTGMYVTRLK